MVEVIDVLCYQKLNFKKPHMCDRFHQGEVKTHLLVNCTTSILVNSQEWMSFFMVNLGRRVHDQSIAKRKITITTKNKWWDSSLSACSYAWHRSQVVLHAVFFRDVLSWVFSIVVFIFTSMVRDRKKVRLRLDVGSIRFRTYLAQWTSHLLLG